MKTPPPHPRSQLALGVVLILLALLAALLWFRDPNHRPAGDSRVDWPSSAPRQP